MLGAIGRHLLRKVIVVRVCKVEQTKLNFFTISNFAGGLAPSKSQQNATKPSNAYARFFLNQNFKTKLTPDEPSDRVLS